MKNYCEIRDGILDLKDAPLRIIGNKEFWSQRALRKVIIPAGMEHIGDWAFAKCINLETVEIEDAFRPGLFGRDVFKGCESLRGISFAGMDETTALFLALCANRLPYDHLIRSEDVGEKSWYEKWDISLVAKLKSDDAEAKMSAALCGEEDISYDGIGSVDGEMPGESADYVSKEEYNKSALCYIRLAHDRYLSDEVRGLVEDHIRRNRFDNGGGSSFFAIFEECGSNISYLQTYLDITDPDKDAIAAMTAALSPSEVVARSYLIGHSSRHGSVLDDLML